MNFAWIFCVFIGSVALANGFRVFGTQETNSYSVFVTLDKVTGRWATHTGPVNPSVLVALGQFREDTNVTGWAFLQVIAQRRQSSPYNDTERAYAAGVAEGFLTSNMIKLHYLNRVKGYCDSDPAYCQRLKAFISQNVAFMAQMVEARRNTDPIWHQVGLWMEQLAGIADGVAGNFIGPRLNMSGNGLEDIYFSNLHGDIDDLEHVLHKSQISWKSRLGAGCSAIVKITPKGDLIAGHATWINYKSMLRLVKDFQLDLFPTSNPGPNDSFVAKVKMTTYPAYLTSLDDFYINSNQLAIFDTTLTNYNNTLWPSIKPNMTIPYAIRSMVASRLAKSGPEWHQTFKQFNSGTGNSEWIVVDYKAWANKQSSEVVTVSDQFPGQVLYVDVTGQLMSNSYFASYNVPAIVDAFIWSNQTGMVAIYGDYFTYDRTARALIFARNQSQVVDIASALQLMRFNNFKQDPLSACPSCNPPYSAALTIASRYDLNLPNGTYPIDFLGGWDSMGATDAKILNGTMIEAMQFLAMSGPTYDQQPPFQWSTSGMSMEKFPHYGQPDLFKFDPVIYT